MPRVNIYIRNEDYEKWSSIGDKPLFISEAINKFDIAMERIAKQQKYHRDGQKKWNDKNKERKATADRMNMRRYMQTSEWKIKHRAHNHVAVALRNGTLLKPTRCNKCGEDGKRIEAHHNDYAKTLEVVWLCRKCHDEHHHPLSAV